MEPQIDIRWLLDVQDQAMPESPLVGDYSALVAAVSRHRVRTPRLGEPLDSAWSAAALLHTIVLLRPLPSDNYVFGCAVAVTYLDLVEEPIDPPYGALIELVREIQYKQLDVFTTAAHLRSWQV